MLPASEVRVTHYTAQDNIIYPIKYSRDSDFLGVGFCMWESKKGFSVVYTTSFTTMMVFGRKGTFAVAINLSRVEIPEAGKQLERS